MRYKKLTSLTAFMLGIGLTFVNAQTMHVTKSSGSKTTFALSNIQKMSFSLGNITVNQIDNTSNAYALEELKALYFSDIVTDIQETWSGQNQILNTYPNPVNNTININLKGTSKEPATLSLLSLEGATLLTQQVSDEKSISLDISHLPSGIYLIRYSNKSEIKTAKIVKQ